MDSASRARRPSIRETWRTDTWVRPFLARYKRVLAASIGLGVAALLFAVGLMFTSGYLISAAAAPPYYGLFELLIPIGFVQIFGLGKPFLGYWERLKSHDWIMRVTSELRRKLYLAFEGQGLLGTAKVRIGEALGLASEDIAHIQNLYLRCAFPLAIAWIAGGLAVLALGAVSWPCAAMLAVGFACITVLVPAVAFLRDAAMTEAAKAQRDGLYATAYDGVAGVADWMNAGRADEFAARVAEPAGKIDAAEARLAARSRTRKLLVTAIFDVLAVGMLAWASWHFAGSVGATGVQTVLVGAGGIPCGAKATVNWIAAFVLGLFPLLEALEPLPDAAVSSVRHLDSVTRLNGLPDTGEHAAASVGCTCEPASADIALSHVTFAYGTEPERTVLRDLTLDIPAGTKLAILGPSGTGKSTLASLLRGDLAPVSGEVTLGGIPAAELNRAGAIPCRIGLMQQASYLFNQSVMGNLKIGKPQLSTEDAERALDAVGLGGWLSRLPHGLDTMVDEAGIGMSGGEARRLALARLLVCDAPVIILDEPCVSLDPATETALLDTMLAAFADRTVIMITHHLAGVDRFDRVIFLRDGRIALHGAPADLAATSVYYRELLAFDRSL